MNKSELLQKRDAKAHPHLEQYAPVWILDEKFILDEDAVQFNVMFQHGQYGWVSRRYRYDGFNNVLYHKGQTLMAEAEVVAVMEREPYLEASIMDIPNAYGG
jgi:hypothetical protein